jgi:hypothetical protein
MSNDEQLKSILSQMKGFVDLQPETSVSVVEKEDSSALHRAIASDRARGCSLETLAEKYSMKPMDLENLEKQEFFQDEVIRMQGVLEIPVEQLVENAATVAFEKRFRLMMTTTDEKILEKITEGFLDRKMGKATSRVEVTSRNFNVSADISQIDKDIEKVQGQINAIEQEYKKLKG